MSRIIKYVAWVFIFLGLFNGIRFIVLFSRGTEASGDLLIAIGGVMLGFLILGFAKVIDLLTEIRDTLGSNTQKLNARIEEDM